MARALGNAWVRVWFLKPPDFEPWFMSQVVIYRAMIADGRARLLLKSHVYTQSDMIGWASQLRDFVDGTTIEIKSGECTNPSDYRQGHLLARYENCIIKRSWTGNLGVLTWNDADMVMEWLDVWSDKWVKEF